MQEDPSLRIDHFHRYWRFVISWKWTQVTSPQPHICPSYHPNQLTGLPHILITSQAPPHIFITSQAPPHMLITSQVVLLVVATVALAAPATPTGAHAAWPLPYAG